ncbi:AAA family ATPase [cf. Phormidesmis sp. LEGE 11477]|uniref:AAA family ATPase n=1 Tax=cf. Phormidesmis sp. LEGE 11477 TaxID=1828680 RepID=UPI0018823980|nr:AAA family ATPase [cf. Phormidesmis sp. LEGE 11477]MBE9064136.1 AAA family ATPase [cf. Phormidesmis sp. LEGE 11477]
MQLQTLTLNNYRGARSLSLDLDARLNVFVGVNGAGKSTVLDAVTLLLSWAVNRIRTANASGRPIPEDDISNGQAAASIELTGLHQNKTVSWRLAKGRRGENIVNHSSNLTALKGYTQDIRSQITSDSELASMPLFVYYPVNRAVLDIPLRIRGKQDFDILTAYDNALTTGANFRTFFEWFREREDLENEITARNSRKKRGLTRMHGVSGETQNATPTVQLQDPQLEAVRNTLYRFLPEFDNLSVHRNPLRMEIEKNEQVLTVNQLSAGEKCLIAMVSDLARRMAIANPNAKNPLEGEGIVLIDEIDLHLHPQWQRIIVPRLLEVFPNCQFLVSTHSPHVLTHVRPDNIFLLHLEAENIVSYKPEQSYGQKVDRILEDLMGLKTTRPDHIASKLHSLYEMISRNQFEEARTEIDSLREEMGADPDLVKAGVLIRRKELIGK